LKVMNALNSFVFKFFTFRFLLYFARENKYESKFTLKILKKPLKATK
jgi:hypothetical protein